MFEKRGIALLVLLFTVLISVNIVLAQKLHDESPEEHVTHLDYNLLGEKTVWAETLWPYAYHYTRCRIEGGSTIYADTSRCWGWDYTCTGVISSTVGTRHSYWGHDCDASL